MTRAMQVGVTAVITLGLICMARFGVYPDTGSLSASHHTIVEGFVLTALVASATNYEKLCARRKG